MKRHEIFKPGNTIQKTLVINTAHITKGDNASLLAGKDIPFGTVYDLTDREDPIGSGYLLVVDPELGKKPAKDGTLDYFRREGFSPALINIQCLANAKGCTYVRLDPDAEIIAELEHFDW